MYNYSHFLWVDFIRCCLESIDKLEYRREENSFSNINIINYGKFSTKKN